MNSNISDNEDFSLNDFIYPTIIRELRLITVLVLGVSSLFLIPRSLVGLEVYLNEKGCIIWTTKTFAIHEKVCYFEGELISKKEGFRHESMQGDSNACYMLYFKANGRHLCIDVTEEKSGHGRLINHSRQFQNVKPCVTKGETPEIYFKALQNIEKGEEILFDYGD